MLAGDQRFVLSRSPRRLGFYRNFERALALAPAGARYVAMADQDDGWHPDKLATLRGADRRRAADLQRRADRRRGRAACRRARTGACGATTTPIWPRCSITNAVTGAASLFPRALLDDALPFPPAQFAHFHDHWIALCALATGAIRYVDRPLYDYVQHGGAFVGHAKANRMPRLRDRLPSLWRDPRERARVWRMHYFVDACRLIQFASMLELRCGDRMGARQAPGARAVRERGPFASPRSGGWPRSARARSSAQRRETLGGEWMLLHAFGWRHLLAATARDRPQRFLRLDAVPPGLRIPARRRRAPARRKSARVADKLAPLRLAVRDDAPRRVNVLIPTIDLEHFFGGYIAKLNLARRLAERGLRVRVVTVDPTWALTRSWRSGSQPYSGLDGTARRG